MCGSTLHFNFGQMLNKIDLLKWYSLGTAWSVILAARPDTAGWRMSIYFTDLSYQFLDLFNYLQVSTPVLNKK